jgi:hypothetical protein
VKVKVPDAPEPDEGDNEVTDGIAFPAAAGSKTVTL